MDRRIGGQRLRRGTILSFCAAIGFSALNPTGWRAFQIVFGVSDLYTRLVTENASPFKHWSAYNDYLLGFWAGVLLFLLVLFMARFRVPLFSLQLSAPLLALSLYSIRYIPFFLGTLLLLPAPQLFSKKSAQVLLLLGGVALGGWSLYGQRTSIWKLRPSPAFSTGLVLKLSATGTPAPIFNSYELGGVIQLLAPQYKTFVDGRGMSQTLIRVYLDTLYNPDGLATLNIYRINTVVINRGPLLNTAIYPLVYKLNASPEWQFVMQDLFTVCFVRKSALNASASPTGGAQGLPGRPR